MPACRLAARSWPLGLVDGQPLLRDGHGDDARLRSRDTATSGSRLFGREHVVRAWTRPHEHRRCRLRNQGVQVVLVARPAMRMFEAGDRRRWIDELRRQTAHTRRGRRPWARWKPRTRCGRRRRRGAAARPGRRSGRSGRGCRTKSQAGAGGGHQQSCALPMYWHADVSSLVVIGDLGNGLISKQRPTSMPPSVAVSRSRRSRAQARHKEEPGHVVNRLTKAGVGAMGYL